MNCILLIFNQIDNSNLISQIECQKNKNELRFSKSAPYIAFCLNIKQAGLLKKYTTKLSR